jgi:hypothetical protein
MLTVSFIIFGFGIISFCSKLIGLELLGVLQLAYFSVIQHSKTINLYISKLVGLAIANGYNQYINNDFI